MLYDVAPVTAVQLTVTCPSPALAETFEGALGTLEDATGVVETSLDAELAPFELDAVTT